MSAHDLRTPFVDIDDAAPPLWQQRDYGLLYAGQFVSAIGSRVSGMATPLLILALTGSPAQAGMLGGIGGLVLLVFALPAGALADRWDRKRLMIVCDLGRAVVFASIAWALWAERLTPAHLYVAALFDGALTTFFGIAHAASLRNVVHRSQLSAAVAQAQSLDAAAQLLGPLIGGACYGLSRMLPFGLDALSYLVSALGLGLIRRRFQQAAPAQAQPVGDAVGEGILWLSRHPLLRFLTVLTLGLMLPAFGYNLVLIMRAQQLGASAAWLGLVLATGGVGTLIGSVLAGPLLRRCGLRALLLGAVWPWVLSWLPLALAPNLVALGIANAVGYVVVPIYLAALAQIRLTVVPDALQGRVNSVYRLVVYGSQPLGLAVTGILLERTGPSTAAVLLFVPQLALAVIVMARPTLWSSLGEQRALEAA